MNTKAGSVEPKNTHIGYSDVRGHTVDSLDEVPTAYRHFYKPVVENRNTFEQLNDYLVKRSQEICENVRLQRDEYRKEFIIPHTSDIIPPLCYAGMNLQSNIDNLLACFQNTLSAALFCESKYAETLKTTHP